MKIANICLLVLFAFLSTAAGAQSKPVPEPPTLKANSYFLFDYDSGRVLAEKNPDKRVEPASLTKLMTAYLVDKALAEGEITLDELVTISKKAWQMQGSKMFVEVGKQVTVEDLLKGVIIQSGNDASIALAERIAGSESAFVGYMNFQAEVLGMTNTSFKNSTGWPAKGHYSTARDLAILAQAVIRDYPETYQIYKEKEFTYNEIRQYNRNRLLWSDNTVDGLKTGHTEAAGYCLVASASRDDMRLISVVLGTSSDEARTQDSQSLLNYGFRFFETRRLYSANEVLKNARVWYGDQEQVAMGVASDISITIPRGRYRELEASMEIDSQISAPVAAGQVLGKVTVKLDDEVIVSENIVAIQAINDGGFLVKAIDSIKLMFE